MQRRSVSAQIGETSFGDVALPLKSNRKGPTARDLTAREVCADPEQSAGPILGVLFFRSISQATINHARRCEGRPKGRRKGRRKLGGRGRKERRKGRRSWEARA